MTAPEIIEHYNNLPTKADQKSFRHLVLLKCKIAKPTFYSWFQRNDIPDEKAVVLITQLIKDNTL